jgi:hypothetical protein
MSDKVQLLRIERQSTNYISKEHYDCIAECILSAIDERENGVIALSDLIEHTHQKLSLKFHGDIPWHLIQVKQDLQARGIIKTFFGIDKRQLIERIKNRKKKFFF